MTLLNHAFRINPGIHQVGRCNTILNARVRTRYTSHYSTNLTLKSVISGTAKYTTRNSVYVIEPDTCLALNRGQVYDLDIQPEAGTETLAVFFEPSFVSQALGAAATGEISLLDDPFSCPRVDRQFLECLHPVSGRIQLILRRIAGNLRLNNEGWLEDAFYDLAAELPLLDNACVADWMRLPAKRWSTRLELYRRLLLARDYAHSCFNESLTLQRLADVACMSTFHFHRMFRHAFGCTSTAYVRRRRLSVARRLLESSDQTVTQICRSVGFESVGSFGTAFRGHFGVAPGQIRTHKL